MTEAQNAAAAPAERKVRSTVERMADLRDVVKRNVDKFSEKEQKLEAQLATIRNARKAAEVELERLDMGLPQELRLKPANPMDPEVIRDEIRREDMHGSSYAPTNGVA